MARPIANTVPELIEQLEGMYPPRCIRPDESLEEAHRYAGRQALVTELREWLEYTDKHHKLKTEL